MTVYLVELFRKEARCFHGGFGSVLGHHDPFTPSQHRVLRKFKSKGVVSGISVSSIMINSKAKNGMAVFGFTKRSKDGKCA